MRSRWWGPLLAGLLVASCQSTDDRATETSSASQPSASTASSARSAAPAGATRASSHTSARDVNVLVFSATEGFRHASIPDGVAAIEELGAERGWDVDATEDPTRFGEEGLGDVDVVVWLSTTGDVLDAEQQAAFEDWFRAGGGYAGVHAAADTEYDWPWYGELVGAWFRQHPPVQEGRITVEDREHASTSHLGSTWVRTDEWYDFRTNPRGAAHVLLTLEEASYEGGVMGADHPTAWCHAFEGGQAWYTAGGHTAASFAEPAFREHLAGGIASVAKPGACP